MSVESLKEMDDFFRSMRQAFNSRDLKTFRSHFWTDKRFHNLDASGRRDRGWGAFEEVLDHPDALGVVCELCQLELAQSHRLNLKAAETARGRPGPVAARPASA